MVGTLDDTMERSVINGTMVGTLNGTMERSVINGTMVGTLDDEWYNGKIIG